MKLRYEAQKRRRIKHSFMGFTTFQEGWWFNRESNTWEHYPKPGEKGISTHQDCRSVRAFRRRLKSAHKGVEFVLISRWVGHNVTGWGSCTSDKVKKQKL